MTCKQFTNLLSIGWSLGLSVTSLSEFRECLRSIRDAQNKPKQIENQKQSKRIGIEAAMMAIKM